MPERPSLLDRRQFLKAAAFGIAGLSLASLSKGGRGRERRPNIVLIMADDMGFSDIGCYGGEIRTPNLDGLAEGGLRFTQFYNTARCCPTRASLLTGLYPHQAGVGHMTADRGSAGYRGRLNKTCVTIAEVLKSRGYRTFVTGKWHVGAKDRNWWPLQRGFDRFYGVPEGGGFYFKPTSGRSIVLDNQVVHTADSGPMPEGWYSTDAWTDYGIKFIEEAVQRKEPFFFYLAHNAPHWPLQALEQDIARYRGRYAGGWDKVRAERHARMIEMGIVEKRWPLTDRDEKALAWDDVDPQTKQKMDTKMAIYAAQIDRMDRSIGRLVDRLKSLGIFDDTLILFLADNGGCAEGGIWGFDRKTGRIGTADSHSSYGLSWANASNTPFRLYKHWVHEGGIATPLIAHWPAVIKQKGKLTHQSGHVIDIMATCCDVAGAPYPKSYNGSRITPLEGKSLLPIFEGRTREGHDAIYWEHEGNRAIRVRRWKLVAKGRNGPWELYDLQKDRSETQNLAERLPERTKKMAEMWRAWAKRTNVLPWPGQKKKATPKTTDRP